MKPARCAILSMKPIALTHLKPPSFSRMSSRYSWQSVHLVLRLRLKQILHGGLAPTATTPPVGWIRLPPKSGSHSSCCTFFGHAPRTVLCGLSPDSFSPDGSRTLHTGTPGRSASLCDALADDLGQRDIFLVACFTGTNGITSTAHTRMLRYAWSKSISSTAFFASSHSLLPRPSRHQ